MDFKIGSWTGNASALVLPLGFVPDALIYLNKTDGETLGVWFNAATDLNVEIVGAAGPVTNAADGVSTFAGEAPGKVLTGLCSIADAAATLTGVGTLFETELQVGDVVKLGDQEFYVVSITSATAAVVVPYPVNPVNTVADGAETSVKGVRKTGRSAGLNLGTDLSEDGDVYMYIAFKQD